MSCQCPILDLLSTGHRRDCSWFRNRDLPPYLLQQIRCGRIREDDPSLQELRKGICCGSGYNHDQAPGTIRHQNTAYANAIQNWVCACDSCFEEIEAEWKERWDEYYAGIL